MKVLGQLVALVSLVLASAPAFAQEAAAAAAPALSEASQTAASSTLGLIGVGIGIMMGLAVLGGTLGQGKAASAALEGVARNPAASGKLTVPLILSLALMESLVLFAFVIAFFLRNSVSGVLSQLVK